MIKDFQLLDANDKEALYIRHSFRADFYNPKVLIKSNDYKVYITKKVAEPHIESVRAYLAGLAGCSMTS